MRRGLAVPVVAVIALTLTGAAPPSPRLLVIVTGESNSGGYALVVAMAGRAGEHPSPPPRTNP
jgi:hypothetical protein